MISGPIYLGVFPKTPMALMLLSPDDVMDSIWEDYADGGRDELWVSRRKMRIPLTNYGKNDKKFGFTWISSFLQRCFGSTPNCSIVNAQPCGCISSDKSKFLLKTAGNKQIMPETMEGGACKMSLCVRTINSRHSLTCVPLVIVLEWELPLRWKNVAVSLLWFHFHLHWLSINNKLNAQNISQGEKYRRWLSKWSNMVLCDKYQRRHLLIGWKTNFLHSWRFISVHESS